MYNGGQWLQQYGVIIRIQGESTVQPKEGQKNVAIAHLFRRRTGLFGFGTASYLDFIYLFYFQLISIFLWLDLICAFSHSYF